MTWIRVIRGAVVMLVLAMGVGAADRDLPPETKDRLPPEEMARLVEGPIAMVRRGDVSAARVAMETMIAAQTDQIAAADLTEAFGVQLYIEGMDGKTELETAALPYLERAIHAYERAFGPDDPEVAVALHSYADVLIALSPDQTPPAAIDSLDRAYHIRLQALGVDDPETIATHIRVNALRAGLAPAREDSPLFGAVLTAVSADMERAIAAHDPRVVQTFIGEYIGLAIRYLHSGHPAEGVRIERLIAQRIDPLATRDADICRTLALHRLKWRGALSEKAGVTDADEAANRKDLESMLSGGCSLP